MDYYLKSRFRATLRSTTWRSTQSITQQCSQKASTRVNWTSASKTLQLATVSPFMKSNPISSFRSNGNYHASRLYQNNCHSSKFVIDTSTSDKIFLIACGCRNHDIFQIFLNSSTNYEHIRLMLGLLQITWNLFQWCFQYSNWFLIANVILYQSFSKICLSIILRSLVIRITPKVFKENGKISCICAVDPIAKFWYNCQDVS